MHTCRASIASRAWALPEIAHGLPRPDAPLTTILRIRPGGKGEECRRGSACVPGLQSLIQKLGIKIAEKQDFEILCGVSSVIKPVGDANADPQLLGGRPLSGIRVAPDVCLLAVLGSPPPYKLTCRIGDSAARKYNARGMLWCACLC